MLAVGVLLVLVAGSGRRRHGSPRAPTCEGLASLCGRHLGEVVFAGTHNSFAASSEPGWYFANQTYGLGRQLADGIRALLLDVHYGVHYRTTGTVRTDLAAEGSDRNKVAEQLPASALRLADRVAGRVGLGTLSGTPELFLCHTLCELGAEPLDRELRLLRNFLQRHPSEVLIVILEDYVPPNANASRLVVFAEEKGGSPAWYMPAFSFIQDTPLGALHPGQLSCARYRGRGDSPLLLINHWIPPFPPSLTLNTAIGKAPLLRSRVSRCTRARGISGAIVAVDFYQRTSVVAVAEELNEQR